MKKTNLLLTILLAVFTCTQSYGADWFLYSTDNSPIPSDLVNDVCLDEQSGDVWLGTIGGGLAHFEMETKEWHVYNSANSPLPNDSVFYVTLSEDRQHTWIATFGGGLAHIDAAGNWTVYNRSNSDLPSNFVTRIVEDHLGNFWVTTLEFMSVLVDGVENGGIVRIDAAGNWTVFNKDNSPLPTNNVFALAKDDENNIWVGTINAMTPTDIIEDGAGLVRIDPQGDWSFFNKDNSPLPSNNIMDINVINGAVCAGTLDGQLAIYSPGGFNPFEVVTWLDEDGWGVVEPGILFSDQHVLSIAADPSGQRIYFGSGPPDILCVPPIYVLPENGLVCFDYSVPFGMVFTYDVANSPLTHSTINDVEVDNNGTVWMATQGGGLAVMGEMGDPFTGIEQPEVQITDLTISPNPIRTTATVSYFSEELTTTHIALFDIRGKQWQVTDSQQFVPGANRIQLDVSELPMGTYFLKTIVNGTAFVEKVVVVD